MRKILLEHLSKPTNLPVDLIPGKSLCPNCATKLFVKKTHEENVSNDDDDTGFNPHSHELIDNRTLDTVDTVCGSLELSPVHKIMKLNKDQRHTALMKKTKKISSAVIRKLEETFSEDLQESTPDVTLSMDEYEKLISKLKEKSKVANKNEKVKIISLLPDSWSRSKISKEFNVSEYLVRQTRELVKEQGILPNLSKRVGHKLCEQVINCVMEF